MKSTSTFKLLITILLLTNLSCSKTEDGNCSFDSDIIWSYDLGDLGAYRGSANFENSLVVKTQGEAGLFLNLLDLDNAEAEAITVEIPSDYRSTTIQIVKDHVILNDRKMLSVYDLNTMNLKYLYNSEENIGRVIKVSDKLYFDLDYGDIYTLDLITGDISLYIVEKEFANATESTIHNISRAQSSNEEFLIISHQSNSQNWITKMHINKEISWSINQSARNLTFLDQMIVITNIDSLKYIDSNSGEIIFTDISPTEFIEIWSIPQVQDSFSRNLVNKSY